MRTAAVALGLVGLGLGFLLLVAGSLLPDPRPADLRQERSLVGAEKSARPEPVAWAKPIEVAAGQAYQGPWRMNDSDFRYVDAPSVAVGPDGDAAVVWVDQARKSVRFQRYGQDGAPRPDPPVDVSRSPEIFSWLPRVAVDAERPHRVYVLWQEIVFSGGSHGGEIFFARSTDGGRTFSAPMNLSRTPAGAGKGRLTARRWDNGSLDLVLGPGEDVYVAWTEYEGALRFRRSGDGGATFDASVHVGGDGREPARGPSLGVRVFPTGESRTPVAAEVRTPAAGEGPAPQARSEGRIYLAWTVGEDRSANIRMAMSDDGGRSFGPPRTAHQRDGHADAPKLVVGADGTLHLAYAESRDGPFGHYRVLYARSRSGDERFEEPRNISGGHGDTFESVNFPSLALDGDGGLHLVWELFPDRREHSRGLGYTASRDGGESFAAPSEVPGTSGLDLGLSGSLQGLLTRKLAVGTDQVAVVNSTFLPGRESRVRLVRGRLASD